MLHLYNYLIALLLFEFMFKTFYDVIEELSEIYQEDFNKSPKKKLSDSQLRFKSILLNTNLGELKTIKPSS